MVHCIHTPNQLEMIDTTYFLPAQKVFGFLWRMFKWCALLVFSFFCFGFAMGLISEPYEAVSLLSNVVSFHSWMLLKLAMVGCFGWSIERLNGDDSDQPTWLKTTRAAALPIISLIVGPIIFRAGLDFLEDWLFQRLLDRIPQGCF